MKACNISFVLSISAAWLFASQGAKAGSIPLEQLLGTYSPFSSVQGDAKVKYLTLKTEAGYLYCFDSRLNASSATYKDQVLSIDCALLSSDERKLPDHGQYLPVRWGARIYLIPQSELTGFCAAINAGIEPQTQWNRYHYYLKGNWGTKVTGDPELPAAYRSLLLDKPISGKVVQLSVQGTAWIDLGSDLGVRPGMTLMNHWLPDQLPRINNMPGMIEPRTGLVTVLKVDKGRCLIEGELLEIGTPITSRRWD